MDRLLVVGVITWGLIDLGVVAYRRRKGQIGFPVQLRYNMPIEIFYTIVPLILVLGFFAFTARDQTVIERPLASPDVKVEVIGKQWAWDFNYVNGDVVLARTSTSRRPGAPDRRGHVVQDKLPTLYLPVDKNGRRSS